MWLPMALKKGYESTGNIFLFVPTAMWHSTSNKNFPFII
jgi:hypothetical protein